MNSNDFPPMPTRTIAAEPVAGDAATDATAQGAQQDAATDTVVTVPQVQVPVVPDATAQVADPVVPVGDVQQDTNPQVSSDQALTFSDVFEGDSKIQSEPKVSFANTFVQEMNDFFSKGGTEAEFMRLIDFRATDIDALSDLDVVKRNVANDYPSLSKEEIDAFVLDKYGQVSEQVVDENGIKVTKLPNPASVAKLKIDAHKGRDSLRALKERFTIPEAQQRLEDQASGRSENVAVYDQLTSRFVEGMNTFSKQIKNGEDLLSDINMQVPPEIKQGVQESLKSLLLESNVVINQSNFDEVVGNVKQWSERLMFTYMGPQIMEAVASDAAARTREAILREQAGTPPKPPTVTTPVATTKDDQAIRDFKNRIASF
jgi:hypothetical protein